MKMLITRHKLTLIKQLILVPYKMNTTPCIDRYMYFLFLLLLATSHHVYGTILNNRSMTRPEATRKKTLFRQRIGGPRKITLVTIQGIGVNKKRTVIRKRGVDKRDQSPTNEARLYHLATAKCLSEGLYNLFVFYPRVVIFTGILPVIQPFKYVGGTTFCCAFTFMRTGVYTPVLQCCRCNF